ncbi:TPA: inorganic diphosphatase [Streptococcus suis]|nr:inorganic diphosphatase [Streptococcus suis]HEM3451442.1 inorganic diphosphatase [Streptococcus suis]HEM3497622.1 inorganic diphosphatase [Streptococcus suis]
MDKVYQVIIDRPIGYIDKFVNQYPINYGYIPNLLAGDGEEQDVYIISKDVRQPLTAFEGELVAIIHRRDDVEDKWVLTGLDEKLTVTEIKEKTNFIEQYFDSWIEMVD